MHTALDDTEMIRLRNDLVDQADAHGCTGVIIDVAALDVLDSFGFTTLRNIAGMARLRGALTVMVRLGMGTGPVATALDLDGGAAYLERAPGSTAARRG